jgi:hypothetical protein
MSFVCIRNMGRDAMRRVYSETGVHCIGMQRFDVYGMQRMDARGRDAMHRVSTLKPTPKPCIAFQPK